jgi:subtilase family serine protease
MFPIRRAYVVSLSAVVVLTVGAIALVSQSTGRRSEAVITEAIDENKLVTLGGNTRSESSTATDLGAVADSLALDHMMLQLKRSPRQEKAAAEFVEELTDPKSPNFHKWLTAAQFGENFGVANADIETIKNWLASQGFTVNSVYPSGMVIDFSGSAGQVARAFHTSIHNLDVDGTPHIANTTDPQIPAALAPAITGIVSLHDFRPHPMKRAKYTFSASGSTYQAVVPADLATIYDLNPLFTAGITGKGQTITVLEDSDLYSSVDWTTFRSKFGLSTYTTATLTTTHPTGSGGNCQDPGTNSNDGEAIIDAEWASASAPGAAIVVATCNDTRTTFGGFIALQNLLNSTSPPGIVSISYGVCEAENGASSNASISALYQLAASEGTSVFVAAGDENAASCDAGGTTATHGIGVTAWGQTPYNVAVGGTDFGDTYANTVSQYWAARNSSTYGSALQYVPEIPWNDSCAGSLLASYYGYSSVYGSASFCDSATARTDGFLTVAGGSGGPSNCYSGTPSTYGVASGTCKGVPKPSWQTGVTGIANDGVRDIPDVSFFAADGVWGHYYIVCYSDTSNGGGSCTGAPDTWAGGGGTSFASPIMAGIQALVNQKQGAVQGNPNPVLYKLAAVMPTVFHTTTQGDIVVNCNGATNCYGSVGTVSYGRGGRLGGTTTSGALSVSNTTFTPAYPAGTAWNFATGLGSIDANALVTNWSSGK